MSILREYVDLDKQKRALKDQLKVIEDKMSGMQEQVIAHMEQEGIDRATYDGITISVRTELWAKKLSKAGVRKFRLYGEVGNKFHALQKVDEHFFSEDAARLRVKILGQQFDYTDLQIEDTEIDELVNVLSSSSQTSFLIEPKFNSQKLSAWIRELDKDDEGKPQIPAFLKNVLGYTEQLKVSTRSV